MSIASINYASSVLGQSVRNINRQLSDLSAQLSTGKLSQTYAGMGANEGFAIAARSQLSNIAGYTDTITSTNININIENTVLQSLVSIRNTVQSAAMSTTQDLNSSGQTVAQQTAMAQLTTMLGVLNTQAGNRYLFSGTAINTPSVATMDDILNGTTTQAGLKTLIAERQQADLGTSGMGRLVQTQPTATSVQLAEDVAGSPFGLKLAAISSTLTGATVTGPSGSPPSISVDLGGTNPNNGDAVTVQFTLPDGSSEQIKLTASSATPLPSGSFAIGATPAATAANLNAALNNAIGTLANTALVAASAMAASDNFFSSPPLRVSGIPLGSATTLVDGSANTVKWYTGNSGPGSARSTAMSRVDDSVTVQYGAQADEPAIRALLQSVAAFAAFSTSPGANSGGQVSALSQRTTQALLKQPGQQTIEDIQTDLAMAQAMMKDASARQTQAKTTLQTIVDQAESASPEQVASQILALQNALQASYQTTSMLSQLSLVKYL